MVQFTKIKPSFGVAVSVALSPFVYSPVSLSSATVPIVSSFTFAVMIRFSDGVGLSEDTLARSSDTAMCLSSPSAADV